jgi:sugar-specific transcriptional regulator TrmB
MDKVNNILKNFSFSEPESGLYTAALKLGNATVSEIAEKAGMGRTVAYFHIKNLLKRNILKQRKSGKKMIVSPIPPAQLAESLQESIGDFKTLIPQLESLNVVENEIPQIEIQESDIAFRKIYDEVIQMPIGSTWKVVEDRKGAEAELKLMDNEYWHHFFSQMAERKIITKGIYTKELLSDINKSITPENYNLVQKRLWDMHTLPESALPIKNLVVLYNNKISFMFPEISMTITIRHSALYYVFDTLFETIFNLSEKIENPWGGKDKNNKSEMLQKPQKATEEDLYY